MNKLYDDIICNIITYLSNNDINNMRLINTQYNNIIYKKLLENSIRFNYLNYIKNNIISNNNKLYEYNYNKLHFNLALKILFNNNSFIIKLITEIIPKYDNLYYSGGSLAELINIILGNKHYIDEYKNTDIDIFLVNTYNITNLLEDIKQEFNKEDCIIIETKYIIDIYIKNINHKIQIIKTVYKNEYDIMYNFDINSVKNYYNKGKIFISNNSYKSITNKLILYSLNMYFKQIVNRIYKYSYHDYLILLINENFLFNKNYYIVLPLLTNPNTYNNAININTTIYFIEINNLTQYELLHIWNTSSYNINNNNIDIVKEYFDISYVICTYRYINFFAYLLINYKNNIKSYKYNYTKYNIYNIFNIKPSLKLNSTFYTHTSVLSHLDINYEKLYNYLINNNYILYIRHNLCPCPNYLYNNYDNYMQIKNNDIFENINIKNGHCCNNWYITNANNYLFKDNIHFI